MLVVTCLSASSTVPLQGKPPGACTRICYPWMCDTACGDKQLQFRKSKIKSETCRVFPSELMCAKPFLIALPQGSAGGQNQGNLMLNLLYNEWRTYLLKDFLLRIDMLLLFGVHYVFLLYTFHSKSHVLIFNFNLWIKMMKTHQAKKGCSTKSFSVDILISIFFNTAQDWNWWL